MSVGDGVHVGRANGSIVAVADGVGVRVGVALLGGGRRGRRLGRAGGRLVARDDRASRDGSEPQPRSGGASASVWSWLRIGSLTDVQATPSQCIVALPKPTAHPSVREASATSDTPLPIGLDTVCQVVPFQWRISPKKPNATPKSSATIASAAKLGLPTTGHCDHAPPWKRYSSLLLLSIAQAEAEDVVDRSRA
ncbi:MAG: hypothetical protein U0470_14035 [Anaerolineae bacterium]